MELVYVLVAAVLAAAGHEPPCWSPDLCVLLVTGEGQVQALLPLMSPSLQHVRSEPAKSSLRGWAPRLLAPWAPRRCLLPCPIGSPLQTAILVNPGFASVSSATLTPRQSGEPSACVWGAPLSRAGPRQQKEFALPPGVLAGWGTYKTGEREDQLPSLSLSREKGSQAFSSLGLQEAPGGERSPLWGLPLLPVSPQESGPQPTCGFRTSTTNMSKVSHLRGEQPLLS